MPDPSSLESRVWELWKAGAFDAAERSLLDAKARASLAGDWVAVSQCLRLLVNHYCLQKPIDAGAAEAAAGERERLDRTASVLLQTALMRYWACDDFSGALAKATEAFQLAESSDDEPTAYAALALTGFGGSILATNSGPVTSSEPSACSDRLLALARTGAPG
jgi:hypothetical protein